MYDRDEINDRIGELLALESRMLNFRDDYHCIDIGSPDMGRCRTWSAYSVDDGTALTVRQSACRVRRLADRRTAPRLIVFDLLPDTPALSVVIGSVQE